ncbi:hypothetical protein BJ741DRAFT_51982 [Chytriomyces cf. hyalinus JEL632]|nr:hypothetical protein BJ741DRAFT_51982 [Chytriomyces cf. hyalinus JEL632]
MLRGDSDFDLKPVSNIPANSRLYNGGRRRVVGAEMHAPEFAESPDRFGMDTRVKSSERRMNIEPNHKVSNPRLSENEVLEVEEVHVENHHITHGNKYEFKPPSYCFYLWDSTPCVPPSSSDGLGPPTLTLHPLNDFISTRVYSRAIKALYTALSLTFNSDSVNPRVPSLNHAGFLIGHTRTDSILMLDRFDVGRRVNSSAPSPTMLLNADIACKLYLSSIPPAKLYCNLIEDLANTNEPCNPFPMALILCQSKNELTARYLAPAYTFRITPINMIRIVSETLSINLLSPSDDPMLLSNNCFEFGYLTIDQARQALLIARDDRLVTQLPLVGVWVKGPPASLTSPDIQRLLAQFLCSKNFRKLDTGANTLLMLHINPEELSRVRGGRMQRPDTFAKPKYMMRSQFYECAFESDLRKFVIYGATARILDGASPLAGSASPSRSEDDIVCILDFSPLDPSSEMGFADALQTTYNITLPTAPPPRETDESNTMGAVGFETSSIQSPNLSFKSATTPTNSRPSTPERRISGQSLNQDSESSNLASTVHASGEILNSNASLPQATSATDARTSIQANPTFPMPFATPPGSGPFDLHVIQQQQAQMCLMFMQKQYEMMLALTQGGMFFQGKDSAAVNSDPSAGTNNEKNRTLNPDLDAEKQQQRMPKTMCSVGTNTSFKIEFSPKNSLQSAEKTSIETQTSVIAHSMAENGHRSDGEAEEVDDALSTLDIRSEFLIRGRNSLPPDTGSNYKPLFTFDSIPQQRQSVMRNDMSQFDVSDPRPFQHDQASHFSVSMHRSKKDAKLDSAKASQIGTIRRSNVTTSSKAGSKSNEPIVVMKSSFLPAANFPWKDQPQLLTDRHRSDQWLPVPSGSLVTSRNEAASHFSQMGQTVLECHERQTDPAPELLARSVGSPRARLSDNFKTPAGPQKEFLPDQNSATGFHLMNPSSSEHAIQSKSWTAPFSHNSSHDASRRSISAEDRDGSIRHGGGGGVGMASLNLSGIESHRIENATFDEGEASVPVEYAEGISQLDDAENERTREMIAQLVGNPEQSFIIREEFASEKMSANEASFYSKLPEEVSSKESLAGGRSDDGKPAVFGSQEVSGSREQMSRATLDYLAKYGLS